jgi:hypothetical protein
MDRFIFTVMIVLMLATGINTVQALSQDTAGNIQVILNK